jgi:hypothetical protein
MASDISLAVGDGASRMKYRPDLAERVVAGELSFKARHHDDHNITIKPERGTTRAACA